MLDTDADPGGRSRRVCTASTRRAAGGSAAREAQVLGLVPVDGS